ncbi:MAG: IS110 family transposase [Halobacillus sp.]|uniref:IS110 family transposase n=1 Tax=Halobacillus sp. TaxID=56800 RepID=UPI003BAF084D
MDFTQNRRLSQIHEQTLIIGVDVAKHKHVARAIDDRGRDLTKRLTFSNNLAGFQALLAWGNELAAQHQRPHIIVGMEPTGHYWLNLAYQLKAAGLFPVVVNPTKVKRSKELDDDSPSKNDTKDAKVIAQIIRDGRYHEPLLPEGIFAELREGMKLHDMIQEDLSALKARMHNALDRYFPELLGVYDKWTTQTVLYLLEKSYLPQDLCQRSEEDLLQELKTHVNKSTSRKKVRDLLQVAASSTGVTVGLSMARQEIDYLVHQYRALVSRLEALEAQLEELVLTVPGADKMIAIHGVGPMTVVAFFAEVGDPMNYRDPKQIIKLAGLNLAKNESGKFKGQTTITKRGRRRLRTILYLVARPLAQHNPAFQKLYAYYRKRTGNQLTGKQAYIALARKLIRIFFVIRTRDCSFNEHRMIQDIPHLSGGQKAA